ncbi:hypothetical protein [Streptomyces enissocaesilis]|uniref:hypothetical protein n=1 Tax=Streptomyces enissocaesilis TaxID=332589 RepID=UPI0031D96D95
MLLLAVDTGRWWLADSARGGLRSTVEHFDERWYRFHQWALDRLGPAPGSPSAGQAMDRLIRRENEAAEWESLVARLTQDAGGDEPRPT